jgi:ribosomal protein L25 (general stress protein Ctc)
MTMTDNAKEYLDEVTRVGKTITINIEIRDADKAGDLMATMYDKNIEKLGVAVKSWGFWDIQTANKLRFEAIKHEIDRHNQEIQRLMNMYDRDFLEQDTKL